MTGHGQGSAQSAGVSVWAEVRSVNNRYLKVNLNCRDRYLVYQSELEQLVRQAVQRGTVHIRLKVAAESAAPAVQFDLDLLESLRRQLAPVLGLGEGVPTAALLALPGVVMEAEEVSTLNEAEWEAIAAATRAALQDLNAMRAREGTALAADIQANCLLIQNQAQEVAAQAPKVVEAYTQRLISRMNAMLAQLGTSVSEVDIIREIGLYAERCDVAEELVRLDSHCRQFFEAIEAKSATSCGRKLDFLTQELLREANTIGSKASDAEIARHVVEIKTAIERIREMVQNVE